jgi:hypothetical protein
MIIVPQLYLLYPKELLAKILESSRKTGGLLIRPD